MSNRVLVLSYFANTQGCCPAEWLDDKVDSLLRLNKKVTLISGPCTAKLFDNRICHVRVPSLSPTDIKHEFREIKGKSKSLTLAMILLAPLILTVGLLLDWAQILLTKGVGGSKLSWLVPSYFVALFVVIFRKYEVCFTTGGPVSAHLTGVLLRYTTRIPLICELQDPLTGEGIGRSSKSAGILHTLEKLIVKVANKVVFVTEKAASEARSAHGAQNVECIYPGARTFLNPTYEKSPVENEEFTLTHLGTLYSSRNFYSLIEGIEILKKSVALARPLRLVNLGEMYGDFKKHHLAFDYVKQHSIIPRPQALAFAAKSTVNVIIQHTDQRSTTTIPYKTYDYLNLGVPILGLTNNPELAEILISRGHYAAEVTNPNEIAKCLESILSKLPSSLKQSGINCVEQTEKLISLN